MLKEQGTRNKQGLHKEQTRSKEQGTRRKEQGTNIKGTRKQQKEQTGRQRECRAEKGALHNQTNACKGATITRRRCNAAWVAWFNAANV
jgi:hypothetical protein